MAQAVQTRTPLARRHKRYIVSGSVVFHASGAESRGTLLNIGKGGLLAQTDAKHSWRTSLSVHFHVTGYPETFATTAEVIRIRGELLAIEFWDEPAGLALLLAWLELQHCVWSGIE